MVPSAWKVTHTALQLGYVGFVTVSFKNNGLYFSPWGISIGGLVFLLLQKTGVLSSGLKCNFIFYILNESLQN